jgi:adenine phosphoribosyltransferase
VEGTLLMEENLRKLIRRIPDFPKKGIVFRDITPLLKNPSAVKQAVKKIVEKFKNKKIDVVVGAESRGFIFASLIANELHAGFVPVRKKGKLPWKTIEKEFELEYGKDAFEIHVDAVSKGDNVLIVDDLLATGGTAKATIDLVESLGGNVVGLAFIVELSFLNGRKKLNNYEVFSLIDFKSEKE